MDRFDDISAEFLLTDLAVGLTFLDVARTSHIQEAVTRNKEHAREAY